MEAPLKHAVKNTITKYLNYNFYLERLMTWHFCRFLSQITIGKEVVVLGLSNTIRSRIQGFDKQQKSTLASRNAIVNSIGSCFDNFKVGVDAIRSCLQDILCFFNKSLMLYTDHLRCVFFNYFDSSVVNHFA